MKGAGSGSERSRARDAWRKAAGYAIGMLIEVAAVAALWLAALLLMLMVKAIAA